MTTCCVVRIIKWVLQLNKASGAKPESVLMLSKSVQSLDLQWTLAFFTVPFLHCQLVVSGVFVFSVKNSQCVFILCNLFGSWTLPFPFLQNSLPVMGILIIIICMRFTWPVASAAANTIAHNWDALCMDAIWSFFSCLLSEHQCWLSSGCVVLSVCGKKHTLLSQKVFCWFIMSYILYRLCLFFTFFEDSIWRKFFHCEDPPIFIQPQKLFIITVWQITPWGLKRRTETFDISDVSTTFTINTVHCLANATNGESDSPQNLSNCSRQIKKFIYYMNNRPYHTHMLFFPKLFPHSWKYTIV